MAPASPSLAASPAPAPAAGLSAGEAAPAERFMALLADSLAAGRFARLVLSSHRGAEPELQRVQARAVTVRGETCLSFVYRYRTRDITKNLSLPEGLAQVRGLIGKDFGNAHLHTDTQEIQFAVSRKGKPSLRIGKSQTPPEATSREHNREKQRWVELDEPFLVELGVTTADHQLIPAMSRKWKQINKFVEVLHHAFEASPLKAASQVHVADFGCGKGYLTFAVHDYLRRRLGEGARVTGVELREDLVRLCSDAVTRLGLPGLAFEQGDVRHYQAGAMDIMIALHACDIATDHAIHMGIRAGASIILCSPCCHKQIRPQLLSPHPMRPILQHGIHLGQEAEMVTDSLRALLLEREGYDTQVFEFISLEHTSKNKMILAVRRDPGKGRDAAARRAGIAAQVEEVKKFYGIREHCLEALLAADAGAAQPSAA